MSYEIVLVEDDPIFTFLLQKSLLAADLKGNLHSFSNGQEAMTFFKQEYTIKNNYVIFLDLRMPVMDGYEFMKTFGALADVSNTVVFILTSSGYQEDMDNLKENPFVAEYITKPIGQATIKNLKDIIADKFDGNGN